MKTLSEAWHRFFKTKTIKDEMAEGKAKMDAEPWKTATVKLAVDGKPYILEFQTYIENEKLMIVRLTDTRELALSATYIKLHPK